MITSAWIDSETTGLDPREAGAFEIALLIYQGPRCVLEKLYRLNPLNEEVKWSEEAYRVHGVTEAMIRSFPPADEVMPEFVNDLEKYIPPEKYVFAGYCCGFDYGHIGAALFRAKYVVSDYFNERIIDVYELVKKAADAGLLPKTDNQKLTTMTKALNIPHGAAHTAMDDIKATRRLYETIYRIQRTSRDDNSR